MKFNTTEKGFISIAAALALSGSIYGSMLSVTTLVNESDNNCTDTASLSLSDAIFCATDNTAISFGVTGTISPPSSGYVIDKNITINGPGILNLDFNTINLNSLFTINTNTSVSISNMMINNVIDNVAIVNNGNLFIDSSSIKDNTNNSSGDAAGIKNTGSLTISNSTVSYNSTNLGQVTSIDNLGSLTISDSNISDNINSTISAYGSAGVRNAGSLSIINSNFYNNQIMDGNGSAIYNSAIMNIKESSFFDNNSSVAGGAIYTSSGSNTSIFNTTISSNYSVDGGGIYNDGDMNISNSTIAFNISGLGGGMASGGGINNGGGNVNIKNTIIANNIDLENHGPDIFGSFNSYGYNLIGTDQNATISFTTGDINGTDPMLNNLALNGSTYSHEVQDNSPLIDTGSCTDITGTTVTSDQISTLRPQGSTCDIGAIEYYNTFTTLTLNLSNLSLIDQNITKIYIIGQDGNAENLIIDPGYTYLDGDNNVSSLVYNLDQNFSMRVDTNTSGFAQSWWVNFSDGKFYQSYDSSAAFKTIISDTLNIFNFNTSASNFIIDPLYLTPPIYNHYRNPNFAPFSIPFDVNGTDGHIIDINVTLIGNSTSILIDPSGSVAANIGSTMRFEIINATTIGNTGVRVTLTDINTSSQIYREFMIGINNEYDVISIKEATGTTATHTTPFTGDLYMFNSYMEYNSTQEIEIEKAEVVASTFTHFREIEDINGSIFISTELNDMTGTFAFDSSTNDYNDLMSAYSNVFGSTPTFSGNGRKVYVAQTSDYLDVDPHAIAGWPNGPYSSLADFMLDQVAGKTNEGIMRSYARDKFILLDNINRDLAADIINKSGEWYEVNEDGTTTGEGWDWNITTVDSKEVLILDVSGLNVSTAIGTVNYYKEEEVFVLDSGVVKHGEYIAAGEEYSYLFLDQAAKNDLYDSFATNPSIDKIVPAGYSYFSLIHTKALCDSSVYQDGNYTMCNQNYTLQDVFGTDTLLKYEEGWQYWNSSALDSGYGINKFYILNPLDGVLINSNSAKTIAIPFDDDSDAINNYVGMAKGEWYLRANMKDQLISEILSTIGTLSPARSIEYLLVYKNNAWYIYSPSGGFDPAISLTTASFIKKGESFWILLK